MMPTDIAFAAVVAVGVLIGAICYRIGRHDGWQDAFDEIESWGRRRS